MLNVTTHVLVPLLIALAASCCFVLVRNTFVLNTRLNMIDSGPGWETRYHALPSYDAMLYSPKYYLLWTTQDWRDWLDRRTAS